MITKCFLTDRQVFDYTEYPDFFAYRLELPSGSILLKWSKQEDWSDFSFLKSAERASLSAMLLNSEWELDELAIITKELLEKVLRYGHYPRTFWEKLDYLLMNCAFKYGVDFSSFGLSKREYWKAYAESEDEFSTILRVIIESKYLKEDAHPTRKFRLSVEGMQRAESFSKNWNVFDLSRYRNNNNPSVFIVHLEADNGYVTLLYDHLSSLGFSIQRLQGISQKEDFAQVSNHERSIDTLGYDFVIFIKSKSSDDNGTFGSVLDRAILIHDSLVERKNLSFLYVADIDNSGYGRRPKLMKYVHQMFDIRIKHLRNLLILDILKNWVIIKSSNDRNIDSAVGSDENARAEKKEKSEKEKEYFQQGGQNLESTPEAQHLFNVSPSLGLKDLAKGLEGIVREFAKINERGSMIGIFGRWGRGKSRLIEELWGYLKDNSDFNFIRVDFHAWKYQDTPATWAYLYEQFLDVYLNGSIVNETASEKKSLWAIWFTRHPEKLRSLCRNFRLNFWRLALRHTMLLTFLGILVLLALGVLVFSEKFNFLTGVNLGYWLLGLLGSYGAYLTSFKINASGLIKKYSIKRTFSQQLGLQAEIQNEFKMLLDVWITNFEKKKIVLFVEDLDRCGESRIIDVIDSLRVFLDDVQIARRVIIISPIDDKVLSSAIALKYRHLNITNSDSEVEQKRIFSDSNLVSEYLDKLFLLAVRLGDLSTSDGTEFFRNMVSISVLYSEKKNDSEGANGQEPFLESREEAQLDTSSIESTVSSKKNNAQIQVSTVDWRESINSEDKLEYGNFQITETEFLYLEEEIKKLMNSTPRKIRILYYRYLLCKSLLSNRVKEKLLGSENLHVFVRLVFLCNVEGVNIDQFFEENLDGMGHTLTMDDSDINLIFSVDEFKNIKRAMDFVCAY